MALTEPIRQQLSDLLAANRVVLFMKGTRQTPQCGFSAQVVQIPMGAC
jgi:monothiol glutaredoxin